MKIILNADKTLEAVKILNRIVKAKSIVPIFSQLKLAATADGCYAEATDIDRHIRVDIPEVKIEEPGESLLPGSQFIALLGRVPSSEIEVAESGGNIEVRSGLASFKLPAISTDDFPVFPQCNDGKVSISVPSSIICRLIDSTAYAICADKVRYILSGINLKLEKGKLSAAATDGKRLAYDSVEGIDYTNHFDIIIPDSAIQEIKSVIADSETVTLDIDEKRIIISVPGTVMVSRLVDGKYPNYEQVIPADVPITATVKSSLLCSAIKRAMVFTDQTSAAIVLDFSIDHLTVSASSNTSGSSREEIAATSSDAIMFGANPGYVIEMVTALGDVEEVSIQLKEPTKPMLVKSGDSIHLIMPVNIAK